MESGTREAFFRSIINANPSPVFVVDEDVTIITYNEAAKQFVGKSSQETVHRRGGDVLHCINALNSTEGCGRAELCTKCVIRTSVVKAARGKKGTRKAMRMTHVDGPRTVKAVYLVTASPFEFRGRKLVLLTLEDISELTDLREIVPICCSCKKIRQDDAYWRTIESFVTKYMQIDFSHSYCPDCEQKFLEDMAVG